MDQHNIEIKHFPMLKVLTLHVLDDKSGQKQTYILHIKYTLETTALQPFTSRVNMVNKSGCWSLCCPSVSICPICIVLSGVAKTNNSKCLVL